jgi:hypothetical protein
VAAADGHSAGALREDQRAVRFLRASRFPVQGSRFTVRGSGFRVHEP